MGFKMIEPITFIGTPSSRKWKCVCDCGKEFVARYDNLKSHTKSCGCWKRENGRRIGLLRKTHGHSSEGKRSQTYQTWSSMIDRCKREKHSHFQRYGGRGISVCDRWMNFVDFVSDMGERPHGMTLDRIDNNRGYYPENCRWATDSTQGNNRSNNRHIEFSGETLTLSQWGEKLGIKPNVLRMRIFNGWSIDRAFHTQIRKRDVKGKKVEVKK